MGLMSDNFCPAPWISLFYQNNKASMCCVDTNQVRMSPIEFRNSKYLSDLKDQFLNGEKPSECETCWVDESNGYKSKRQIYNEIYSFVRSGTLQKVPTLSGPKNLITYHF